MELPTPHHRLSLRQLINGHSREDLFQERMIRVQQALQAMLGIHPLSHVCAHLQERKSGAGKVPIGTTVLLMQHYTGDPLEVR